MNSLARKVAPMLFDMSAAVSSNAALSFARMFAAFFESCLAVSRDDWCSLSSWSS